MKCKHCKKTFTVKYFLQKYCMEKDECIKAFANGVKEKKELQNSKARKQMDEAVKVDNDEKKLKASKLNTKVQVHAFVRNRDKHKPCISCGIHWNADFQAGHHYKSETFETLKYNVDNIHGQCQRCNLHLDGAFDNYALSLPKRIGIERYNELVRLAGIDKQQEKVWNLENLKQVRTNLKPL
jgi:hypothetical protein